MLIRTNPDFDKHYRKRIVPYKALELKFSKRVSLFKANRKDPMLEDHALRGAKSGLRAFSIAGDVRVIYREVNADEVVFLDIGSHNQVY